jgi:hypothetical protein
MFRTISCETSNNTMQNEESAPFQIPKNRIIQTEIYYYLWPSKMKKVLKISNHDNLAQYLEEA